MVSPASCRTRSLRRNATDAEQRLWRHLRGRGLDGHKFRRQHPIGPYIPDFLCLAQKLAVELDGGQHAERAAEDACRTRYLEAQGYRVLRFWNADVLANPDGVLAAIRDSLMDAPDPLPRGEGAERSEAGEGRG